MAGLLTKKLILINSNRLFLSSSNSFIKSSYSPSSRNFSSSISTQFWPFSSTTTTTPPPPPPPPTLTPLDEVLSSPLPPSPEQFFLPTTPPIPTGTLDLTSLASSFGPHPIQRLESLLFQLHDSLSLPWWLLIPLVTLSLRLLLLPFFIRSQQNAARMAIIQPRLLIQMNKLKAAKATGDLGAMQQAQIGTQQLMTENNVNPLKSLVFPLAQGGVFMIMFFALKGLAGSGVESLSAAGEALGWVVDWGAKDPKWVGPMLSSALTLGALEVGIDKSTTIQTTTTKNMKTFMRVGLIVFLPFMAQFPAIIFLFWAPNNLFSLLQSLLFRLPSLRSFLSIPTPPIKPSVGEPGYVKEPGFLEAFKEMQIGVGEKWEEQKVSAQRIEEEKRERERKGEVRFRGERGAEKRRVLEVLEEDGEVVKDLVRGIREGKEGREERIRRAREKRLGVK